MGMWQGKTIIGEIGEELAQDVMNGISNKFTTNPDLPVLSTKEDAIINPVNMLKTAAITAPIVAVAGGTNRIANLAYQKAYLMKQGSNKKVTDAILKYSDAVYSKVNGETDIGYVVLFFSVFLLAISGVV